MERRKFLIGMGSAAAGASALVGSGAFSRVQSQRSVTVQVADDEDAYLGLKPLSTPNSNNYVELDANGHLKINVNEHDDFSSDNGYDTDPGKGVNSDSFTWFDGMFEICNQGKAEIESLSYTLPDHVPENDYYTDTGEDPDSRPNGNDAQTVPTIAFYFKRDGDRVIIEPDNNGTTSDVNSVPLELGTCDTIGLRTVTKGISAYKDDDNSPSNLISGDVVLTADAPDAGST